MQASGSTPAARWQLPRAKPGAPVKVPFGAMTSIISTQECAFAEAKRVSAARARRLAFMFVKVFVIFWWSMVCLSRYRFGLF